MLFRSDGQVFSYVFGYLDDYDIAKKSGLLELTNITDTTWATHAAELCFVFGNPSKMCAPFSPKEKRLSTEMMHRWANFARSGNPSNSDPNKEEYWSAVKPSSSELPAADPSHLMFSANGGTMVQSDKNKMNQCSAIFVSRVEKCFFC